VRGSDAFIYCACINTRVYSLVLSQTRTSLRDGWSGGEEPDESRNDGLPNFHQLTMSFEIVGASTVVLTFGCHLDSNSVSFGCVKLKALLQH